MLCGAKTLENGECKIKTRKGGKCWRHKDNGGGGDLDEKNVRKNWHKAFVLNYVGAAIIDMTDDVDKYRFILEAAYDALYTKKEAKRRKGQLNRNIEVSRTSTDKTSQDFIQPWVRSKMIDLQVLIHNQENTKIKVKKGEAIR
jgi:hypothetical protein